jgi:hypothetical protein
MRTTNYKLQRKNNSPIKGNYKGKNNSPIELAVYIADDSVTSIIHDINTHGNN